MGLSLRAKLLVLFSLSDSIPFFTWRYYFVVHDSGMVPAKLPALLRSLLHFFVCLKQKTPYITVSPCLFAKNDFLCKKIKKKTYSKLPMGLPKGKNSFVGFKKFLFLTYTYLAICCTDMLIHSTSSISGHHHAKQSWFLPSFPWA